MPDWEKIEFQRKSLKRKETYNEFGKKIRFEPLQSIPKFRKLDSCCEDYQNFRETLIWSEKYDLINETDEFIKLAKSKGFSEEQSLFILNYNNFDESLSKCDLNVYESRKGIMSDNDKSTIKLIIDNILRRIECGKNRDLNKVLIEFPAHSIGELLDFYANNRLYIKRKTLKEKTKRTGIMKSQYADLVKDIDYMKCGSILRRNSMRNTTIETIELKELLSLERSSLDKYLWGKGNEILEQVTLKDIDSCLKNKACQLSSDNQDDNISTELEILFKRLEEIECWMKPAEEEEFIRHDWDNMDVSLLLMGLQKYGPNFVNISEVINTKTPAMVESFYLTFKDKYGLDKITVEAEDYEETLT